MSCNHKRVWEMMGSSETEKVNELLNDGWEPYAVVPPASHRDGAHLFKRLKPCEKCEKEL